MRILQHTALDLRGIGGVEKHTLELSDAFKALGHDVVIGSAPPARWCSVDEPFIFHTHGHWPGAATDAAIRACSPARWVHTYHGTSFGRVLACREYLSRSGWKAIFSEARAGRRADFLVAVSEQAALEARRYLRVRKPIAVIPNGANPEVFRPAQRISRQPRLFFAGRDDRAKNVKRLISATDQIHAENPALELWVAPGLPVSRPYIRNLGPLEARGMAAVFADCRAVILCSVYEGDPLVLREAQAVGLPVIASSLPQLQANLDGYGSAVWVNPQDVSSIASGIRRALDPDAFTSPTPRLRSWKTVAEELSELYRGACGASR